MAKKIIGYICRFLRESNSAPPVDQLGQHGVNIMGFCKELAKGLRRMRV